MVNVPPPLTVQVTPALFLSLVTIAFSVVVSPGSTVEEVTVIATLIGGELPPQLMRRLARLRETRAIEQTPALRARCALNIRGTSQWLGRASRGIWRRANWGQTIRMEI